MIRWRERAERRRDTLLLTGWLFADLLLGLMFLFLASTAGSTPPPPPPGVSPTDAVPTLVAGATLPDTSVSLSSGAPSTPAPPVIAVGAIPTPDASALVPGGTPSPTAEAIEERQFDVLIQPINLRAGLRPDFSQQDARVMIRGTRQQLDQITDTRIVALVDLASITSPSSPQNSAVEARLPSDSKATVLGVSPKTIKVAVAALPTPGQIAAQSPPVPLPSISRDPVPFTIKINAAALRAGDAAERDRVRAAITQQVQQVGITERHAGFVITQVTAPHVGDGESLAHLVNGILREAAPDVFHDAATRDNGFENPSVPAYGDTTIEVFLYVS